MQNQMTRIHIPVPPEPILECAIGYGNQREARYLALWWESCGDEVMVSDGYVTFTGHWPGYLAYVQHRLVAPALVNYNLGSSEAPATHRILIDLESRQAYIVLRVEGERILAFQWEHHPQTPPALLFIEDLEALLLEWTKSKPLNMAMEEVMRRMEGGQKAVEALHAWLDAQIL